VVTVASLSRIYAVGGYDGTGAVTGLVEEFDPTAAPGFQWTVKGGSMTVPRAEMAVAVGNNGAGDMIYAIGGYLGGWPFLSCDNETYDPVGDSWTQIGGGYWFAAELPSTAKYRLAGAEAGGKVYAIGGEGDGNGANWTCNQGVFPPPSYNTLMEEFDPLGMTWATKSPMVSTPSGTGRSMQAAATEGGKIYVIGGFTGYQFGPSLLGEDNRSTVTWTFSATAEWDFLDFYLFANDYGDIDACSPPGQEGWSWTQPVYNRAGTDADGEGSLINCGQPLAPFNTFSGGGPATVSILTNRWGDTLCITCPLIGRAVTTVVDNGGDRPAGRAYFGDTVQVFTSLTNNGKVDTVNPGEGCMMPMGVYGTIKAQPLPASGGCSAPWVNAETLTVPLNIPILGQAVFRWTYSIEGTDRSIRQPGWCQCWDTGVGCTAPGVSYSGSVYWESAIKGCKADTATLYIEAPPISITSTLWVEPDKDPLGGLPALPLGRFTPGVAGPVYYMCNEWVEGRFIFTNKGTHKIDIIPDAYVAGLGIADVQVVAGFPEVAPGVPLTAALTLAPNASATVTWAYEPAVGGSLMNGCISGDIGVAIVAGARGVCSAADFMYRAHPFVPYDVGAETDGAKAMKMNGPSSGYQAVPFDITISLTNSATRAVQIAAPASVTLYVDYNPILPCATPDWTLVSGPAYPLPAQTFARSGTPGDKITYTFKIKSDCEANMCSQAGFNWDTAALPVGNPCFSGCIPAPGSCNNGPLCTAVTPPGAVTITSFTATPKTLCDDPWSLVKVEMGILNNSPDNTLTVTKFCDGWQLGTFPTGTYPAGDTYAPTQSPWPALGAITIPPLTESKVTWYFDAACSFPGNINFGCFINAAGMEEHPYVLGYMTPKGTPVSADLSGIWPQIQVYRPSSFSCSIWVDKDEVSVGLPVTVYLSVTNEGGNDAADFTADVVASGLSGGSVAYASGPIPVPPGTFTGTPGPIHCATPSFGQTGRYVFTFTALTKGKVSFTGSARWRDTQCDAAPVRVSSCTIPRVVNIASAAQLSCSANAIPLVTMSMSCTGCVPLSACNPATGAGCITVQMLASNFGDISLVAATPSPSFGNIAQPCDTVNVCRNIMATGQGSVVMIEAPPESKAPVELSPKGSRTFTWSYLPTGLGCVQLRTSISGRDNASGNTLYCDAYTNCVEILPRWPMELRLMPGKGEVAPGQEFIITVEVCNPGATKASMQGGEPTLQFYLVSTGANVTEQFEVIPPLPADILSGACLMVPVVVKVRKLATVGQVQIRLSQGNLFIARDKDTGSAIPAIDRGTPMTVIVTGGDSDLKIRENPVRLSRGPALITYVIADAGRVAKRTKLKVYTLTGELVRTLVDKIAVIETGEVLWDGRNDGGQLCASGVYLVRLEGPNYSKVKKLALVK
jgi:hypothetical protein